MMLLWSDAHCHDNDENDLLAFQRQEDVLSIVNAGTPDEWARHQSALGTNQHLSFGIHPWMSNKLTFEEVLPFLEETAVVGEIGLDSEWTDVALETQQAIFQRQLAFAAERKKPVILHTKGQEAAILDAIRQYPNRYFVHWYSSPDWIEAYLALDCYMSIGVDVVSDPAVQALAQRAPSARLLLESDGLESIAWAWGRPIELSDYAAAMQTSASKVAELRSTSIEAVITQARENLARFLA